MIKHLPTAIANTLWKVFSAISIMENEVLVLNSTDEFHKELYNFFFFPI